MPKRAARPRRSRAAAITPTVRRSIERGAFAAVAPTLGETTQLLIDATPYPERYVFSLPEASIVVPRKSVLVFVDDMPGANWGHPCRYNFHDPASGELFDSVSAQFPPTISDPHIDLRVFHGPVSEVVTRPARLLERLDWRSVLKVPTVGALGSQQRYAVLFTSQISNDRHVADLEFLWRVLVDVYGFDTDKIYVLCYDGTVNSSDHVGGSIGKWGGDSTDYRMQVWRSATKANLQAAFDELQTRLTPNDLLLVHTNNHGTTSGLCIDSSAVLTPTEFGTMLSGLSAFDQLVVMMEQCYSGAFQDATLDNSTASSTVFTSAAPANEVSWGGNPFDAFAGVWIEALFGAHADGSGLSSDPDTHNNGRLSMKEVFDYAKANDTSADHPVFADRPLGCGANVCLGAVTIEDLLPSILKYLERMPELVPRPDPPPEFGDGAILDPVAARSATIHRQLVSLAKAIGPYNVGQ